MSVNKSGGGNKTNINGLKFEQETSLNEALLCLKGYSIREHTILYNNKEIGLSVSQTKLYTKFLKEKGLITKTMFLNNIDLMKHFICIVLILCI